MTEHQDSPVIDVTRPSIARAYDAMLGGKDNFEIDRQVTAGMLAILPEMRDVAINARELLRRGVRYLAAEAGIEQFLDLGSGLPTQENTHQVAQRHRPGARVVYVDNDPIVLAHGRAILAENGDTVVVTADLRHPDELLAHADVRRLLDFDRPIAVMLLGVLHHLQDSEDPEGVAAAYMRAVPSGSHLFYAGFCRTSDTASELEQRCMQTLGTGRFRTVEETMRYFDGLDLIEPGLVPAVEWRPDTPIDHELSVAELLVYAALARKP